MADKSKQYFTALDIGTSKICAIVAEKTDNNKLKIIGFSETESEGVSEGMIQNLIKATVKIKEVVIKAKGRHDPCVLPRAVPMVDSMVALVLADHLLLHHAQCSIMR